MGGDFYLNNHKPLSMFASIVEPTKLTKKAYDFVTNEMIYPTRKQQFCFCAGFVCKPYSLENNNRHNHASLEDMFSLDGDAGPHIMTFFAASDHIDIHRPYSFVLENTKGCIANIKGLDEARLIFYALRTCQPYQRIVR